MKFYTNMDVLDRIPKQILTGMGYFIVQQLLTLIGFCIIDASIIDEFELTFKEY